MIGIIANPASGKDIRRVVAHGATVSDHEKINILRRILSGIAALGVDAVRWMPTVSDLVERAADGLGLRFDARPIDLTPTDSPEDSLRAAEILAAIGAACVVVLGGDGTCRMVARGAGALPILPVSTGTNNAFPQLIEGTLAGLAAAIVARGIAQDAIVQAPCLRILREDTPVDLALIDVAIFEGRLGARAVWQLDRVRQVISTRVTPGTIGLSAIAGYLGLTPPENAAALSIALGPHGRRALIPVAPGVIEPVGIDAHRWLADGDTVRIDNVPCVLALDGEREFIVRSGMLIDVQVDRHGPRVIQAQRALALGVEAGVFASGTAQFPRIDPRGP